MMLGIPKQCDDIDYSKVNENGSSPSKMKTVRMLKEKYRTEIQTQHDERMREEYIALTSECKSHDEVVHMLQMMYKDDTEMDSEYFLSLKLCMSVGVELDEDLRRTLKVMYGALSEKEKKSLMSMDNSLENKRSVLKVRITL